MSFSQFICCNQQQNLTSDNGSKQAKSHNKQQHVFDGDKLQDRLDG